MKIKDYVFNIGDEVISVDGIRGSIIDICHCERCEERGFFEPIWRPYFEHECEYITSYEAEFGFGGYHKIGNYSFHPFDKSYVEKQIIDREQSLARLKRQLQTIEELESTGGVTYETVE